MPEDGVSIEERNRRRRERHAERMATDPNYAEKRLARSRRARRKHRKKINRQHREYNARRKADPEREAARQEARRAEWLREKADPVKMEAKRESDRRYRSEMDQEAIDHRNRVNREYVARRRLDPGFRKRQNGYSLAWWYRNKDRVRTDPPEPAGVVRRRREALEELWEILVELDATTGGAPGWNMDPYPPGTRTLSP